MRLRYILFFAILPLFIQAQFQDDFEDGDFLSNPIWEGDTDKFVLTAGELQLNDTNAASPAQLFTRVSITANQVWEFYFRQAFAPSSSNFGKIYLSAESEDLTGELNGYYLKLGGISGSDDALELYRQTGNTSELLISGSTGALGAENNQARVRVERDNAGNWRLLADYTGGTQYIEEGTTNDTVHPIGSLMGVICTYSSSRSDKFFFDNFLVMPLMPDTEAPHLLDVEVLDAQTLRLRFNEALDEASATQITNYSLNPIIPISNAVLNGAEVVLQLASPLQANVNYTLTATQIADISNNTVTEVSIDFFYVPPVEVLEGDIIINEIFADPSPSIGLPEAEFVELYNRSDKTFNLKDFILADAVKEIDLPEFTLAPNTYVVLYAAAEADYSTFGNALALDDFLGLGNSADELSLISPNGDIIDVVNYEDSWYQASDKDDGGWTLERINPDLLCERSGANWRASQHVSGGTPARQNSIFSPMDDVSFVGITRIALVGDDRLRVFFEEALDATAVQDLSNYDIAGLQIISAELEAPLNTSLLLRFDVPLVAEQNYSLSLSSTFTDCLGNTIQSNTTATFALPSLADDGDIVINEILFNPASGGVDFVELYNRSNKVLDLRDLFIANQNDDVLENVTPIASDYLLLPDAYVVLSSEPEDIKARYTVEKPSAFIEIKLPSLPDDEGSLVLYRLENNSAILIDGVFYLNDWHSPLLDDENGVSLERVHPDAPSHMPSSWHSAAAAVGYATPTYRNSQFFEQKAISEDVFSIPVSAFSPNEDGYQDFLLINYATDRVGYVATVRLFDEQGRLVKRLANNEILARSGNFKWDGSTDEGIKARLGIYILSIEYFTPDGIRATFQSTCALAGKID